MTEWKLVPVDLEGDGFVVWQVSDVWNQTNNWRPDEQAPRESGLAAGERDKEHQVFHKVGHSDQ